MKAFITELNHESNNLSITIDGITFNLKNLSPEEYILFSKWDNLAEHEKQAKLEELRKIADENFNRSCKNLDEKFKNKFAELGITEAS